MIWLLSRIIIACKWSKEDIILLCDTAVPDTLAALWFVGAMLAFCLLPSTTLGRLLIALFICDIYAAQLPAVISVQRMRKLHVKE